MIVEIYLLFLTEQRGSHNLQPALTTILVPAGKIDYYKQRLPEELHDKILELKYEK